MKTRILPWLIAIGLNWTLQADTVFIFTDGNTSIKLPSNETDFVRENLVHIFDSANFHQMPGGILPVKSKEQIQGELEDLQSGAHLELILQEPARIVVEGTEIKTAHMWVSIRESDGFVFDWILQLPTGEFVSLSKPRGELILQFAPHVLNLLQSDNLQNGTQTL